MSCSSQRLSRDLRILASHHCFWSNSLSSHTRGYARLLAKFGYAYSRLEGMLLVSHTVMAFEHNLYVPTWYDLMLTPVYHMGIIVTYIAQLGSSRYCISGVQPSPLSYNVMGAWTASMWRVSAGMWGLPAMGRLLVHLGTQSPHVNAT